MCRDFLGNTLLQRLVIRNQSVRVQNGLVEPKIGLLEQSNTLIRRSGRCGGRSLLGDISFPDRLEIVEPPAA